MNATDNSGDIVETNCHIPSGSNFSIGVTEVLCLGHDRSGNNGTCTFQVNITQGEIFKVYSLYNLKLPVTSKKLIWAPTKETCVDTRVRAHTNQVISLKSLPTRDNTD